MGYITRFRMTWGIIVGWTRWLGEGVKKRCLIMFGNVDWMEVTRLVMIATVTTLIANECCYLVRRGVVME